MILLPAEKLFNMDQSYYIAIDMGAGSIRVLVGKVENDLISYEEVYRFANEIKTIDGHDKWDIEKIFEDIRKGISAALKNNPSIKSVGVDSWGVDYVLLNEKGELVEIPYAYRDSRTENMMEKWTRLMSEEETFKRTGVNFYVFNTLFQLLAAKNSKALKKTDKILFIPNYIYYRLTGVKFNEITIASTSQLLSAADPEFDTEILDKLGLHPDKFGSLEKAGKIIGKITDTALPPNNLKAVSVCNHDTASAVAAIPVEKEDFLFIATGTWCILGTESKIPLLTEPARALGFTNERGCEDTFRVLKNIVGLWLIQGIQKALPDHPSFDELEKMADKEKDLNLLVDPESPLFYNPDNMLEAFDAYFEKTGQSKPSSVGGYIVCAYKSLSVAFAYYLNKLQKLTDKTYEDVHVFGGGSQSEMLCQLIADYTGKTVVSGPVEAATYGNIMVQAIAYGNIKNIKEGRRIIGKSITPKHYKPAVKQVQREEIFKKYISLKTY